MNLRSKSASRTKAIGRRVTALGISAAVLAGAGVAGGLVTSAQGAAPATGAFDILLGVGADSSQRIASWYYPGTVDQALEIEKASETTAGAFNAGAASKTLVDASEALNTVGDTTSSNAHASIKGLQPATSYTYHVGPKDGTNWSTAYTFTTSAASGDFDFLFFGDPQIGSSGNVAGDGAGWAATLDYATQHEPNAQLYVSGGDQVESANDETQWTAFADSSPALKQHTWAATIGNHDVGGKAYEQHNKLPNWLQGSLNPDYYPGGNTSTNSGGDYWFIYNDVLFIDLNSNAYTGGADAAHVNFVRGVIGQVGDQAKWTVLVYHHSIYSPADHANDPDNQQRRYDFTTAFSKLGVDLVLQGHDHSYSRSYSILNGHKANPAEQPKADEVFPGPGGVIYVTANSASGSKYYDLTAPDASKSGYGADPLDPTGKRHWANSVENQEHVRTYIKVGVTDDKLDVSTIRSGNCDAPNSAIAAQTACGQTLKPVGSFDPAPIGSKVDQFQLDKNATPTSVSVSASASSLVSGSTTPVILTAQVGGGLGALSGTVAFYDNGALLGNVPLSGSGASYTVPATPAVGTHSYSAQFLPETIFVGVTSSSAAVNVTVTAPVVTPPPVDPPAVVAKSTSTTVVKYAKGKITVTVTAAKKGLVVTGKAKVYDGAKVLKTVSIVKGKAAFSVKLKKGTHKLHANFAATKTVLASSSKTISVKVAK